MLVVTARRVRSERGNAAAIGHFERLRIPRARRTVRLGWQPLLDVPTIDRGILRFLAQLHNFTKQRAGCGVALLKFSANPRQAIPAQTAR